MSCCHLLRSTPSVLLRDGSVSPMEEQEPMGNSQGPRAGDVQVAGTPLGPLPRSDTLQGPCDGGLETRHLPWAPYGWLLIAGVGKSTRPLIHWLLEKCLSVAYLIFPNRAHNVQCFQIWVQSAPNTSDKAKLEQRDHSAKDWPACISNKPSFGDF